MGFLRSIVQTRRRPANSARLKLGTSAAVNSPGSGAGSELKSPVSVQDSAESPSAFQKSVLNVSKKSSPALEQQADFMGEASTIGKSPESTTEVASKAVTSDGLQSNESSSSDRELKKHGASTGKVDQRGRQTTIETGTLANASQGNNIAAGTPRQNLRSQVASHGNGRAVAENTDLSPDRLQEPSSDLAAARPGKSPLGPGESEIKELPRDQSTRPAPRAKVEQLEHPEQALDSVEEIVRRSNARQVQPPGGAASDAPASSLPGVVQATATATATANRLSSIDQGRGPGGAQRTLSQRPEVRIGQVNVVVEAPPVQQSGTNSKAQADLSSRLFLRSF